MKQGKCLQYVIVFLVWTLAMSHLTGCTSISDQSLQTDQHVFIVTDSAAEFSGVQGKNRWFYGYIEPGKGTEFSLMSEFRVDSWQEGEKGVKEGTWRVDETKYWTSLRRTYGHPNGPVTAGGKEPTEHWAVRRWISSIEGKVQIRGFYGDDSDYCGEGSIVQILIDGEEVFSSTVVNGQATRAYEIKGNVRTDSAIDWVIMPGETDGCDATTLTGQVLSSAPLR